MKIIARLVGTALLGLAGAASPAQDDAFAPGWYVAPMLSYTHADKRRHTGGGEGLALAVGNRGDIAAIELSGIYTRFSTGEAHLTGGSLGLVLGPFFEQPVLGRFFGVLGFGGLKEKNIPSIAANSSSLFGDAGLGYLQSLTLFSHRWALRAELRYRYDYQEPPHAAGTPSSFGDWVMNVGLQIPLFHPAPLAPKAETVAVVPPVAEADDDGDGVPNSKDQCPGTSKGTMVNDDGCASAAKVPEPAEPAPPPLAKTGDALVLSGVTFAIGKAELTPESLGVLDDAAKKLVAAPDVKVEVGGHTDNTGRAALNKKLSQQRAEAVRDYLIGQGVPAERLTAVGYGDTQPSADNDTEENRAKNRRVELKVVASATSPSSDNTTH